MIGVVTSHFSTKATAVRKHVGRRNYLLLLMGCVACLGCGVALDAEGADVAKMNHLKDQASNDLATILAMEFSTWFRNLGERGILPRAFTGVKRDGRQVVVILTDLPLDDAARRKFLIWLCRDEHFIAYAYGTHVGIAADNLSAITEGIDIYASSERYDVTKTMTIAKDDRGRYKFSDEQNFAMIASPENGIFFGLNRSTIPLSSEDQEKFSRTWRVLERRVMWRQR